MNWSKISNLNKEKIVSLQNKKIKHLFSRYIHFVPYYSELLNKNGIDYKKITSIKDLEKLPFTTKEDLAPTLENKENPRKFIMQPNEELIKKYYPKSQLISSLIKNLFKKNIKEILEDEFKPIHTHFTTGRTSLAVPFLYTSYDLCQLEENGKRLLEVFCIKQDFRCLNIFPYAPHLAFWQTFFALKANKLLSLQTGGGKIMGTEKIISAIESFKADVIIGMPGYTYHMLKTAAEQNKNYHNLKFIIFGGERIPQGLKEKIKDLLAKLNASNVQILSTYAFTEGKTAWAECCNDSGYHLYPDMEFIEIIGKDGQRVNEGEKGVITYTSLGWRGSIVVRYKTGDIGSLHYEKCPHCNRTVPRIDAIIERSSEIKEFNLAKIKGTFVNLNQFFLILMGYKGVDEWQVEIKKRNNDPYEVDELVLYIYTTEDRRKLQFELANVLKNEMEITPEIIFLSRKEMIERLGLETELKEKRIVDNRMK